MKKLLAAASAATALALAVPAPAFATTPGPALGASFTAPLVYGSSEHVDVYYLVGYEEFNTMGHHYGDAGQTFAHYTRTPNQNIDGLRIITPKGQLPAEFWVDAVPWEYSSNTYPTIKIVTGFEPKFPNEPDSQLITPTYFGQVLWTLPEVNRTIVGSTIPALDTLAAQVGGIFHP
ncbi:hypothetical protein ACUY3K_06825 [Corynebacterium uberis]|uniref:hypothetical protein n=1 Tax=Corynebacterium TaxID=1716 RepID=UPI001D0ADFDE|nr:MULTISPECIES: hypothetical protein [Corynebacterium]MCZ9308832.1 hypothetical protein [Corynebacterium sp. c6VSa_13]UDL72641.1 hypothetical protein LH391_05760 [Corynebacterium uberis]UDL76483.1 hypothetical protein LH393_03645 [Corynebacterium uberis]UDL78695.1 hypothetical protein LH394_03630 [Corynebacterium uberis]UDL80974.1 hypothetical protein LH392_04055 [Corynebacterium uberis]